MKLTLTKTGSNVKCSKSLNSEVLALDDGTYTISIEKLRNKRSIEQNRLYFGPFLGQIVESFKEKGIYTDKHSLHEEFKARFLFTYKKSVLTKRNVKIVKSTTNLTTKDFKRLMDKINEWLIEHELPVPDLSSISESDLEYWSAYI